jgi:hypothetical protein
LITFASKFRGDNTETLSEYLRDNEYLAPDKLLLDKMISNYDSICLESGKVGECLIYLIFKTFFSKIPTLPFRSTEDACLLKTRLMTDIKGEANYLNEIIGGADGFFENEENVKQKILLEIAMVIGSLYSSQTISLPIILEQFIKCFDLNSSAQDVIQFSEDLFKIINVKRDRDIKVYPIAFHHIAIPNIKDLTFPANDTLFSDTPPDSVLVNLERKRVESSNSKSFSKSLSNLFTTSTPMEKVVKISKEKSSSIPPAPVFIPPSPKIIVTRSMRRRADQVHES